MEQAVAFMIGTSAVMLGLSLFIHWQDWSGWLRMLRAQGRPAALMMGYLHLIIGTFIVGFHWNWQGWSLLVTLIGVKAIAEGVVYALCPKAMLAMLAWCEPRHYTLLRATGLFTVAVGAIILRSWLQGV